MLRCLRNFLIFTIIGVGLFLGVQFLFMPKWDYPRLPESTRLSLLSFDKQEENVDEVLFFGTSHSYYSISPTLMYEQNGIVGWNLSTAGQPLGVSYYLLKHALKTQSPKLVVMDAGMLAHYYDGSANWRYILDNIQLDADKLAMSEDYEDMISYDYDKLLGRTQDDSISFLIKDIIDRDGRIYDDKSYFWSGLFSMIQYHGRWKELSETDFIDRTAVKEDYYSNGYYMSPLVTPAQSDSETVDAMAANSYADVLQKDLIYEWGTESEHEAESYLYSPSVLPQADAWLKKIAALCDEAGAKLLLIKVPTNQYITDYDSAWNSVKSRILKEYADENDFTFLDLMFDAELGIDWSTDTLDGGAHLNYLGASKLSSFLGNYIADNYGLGGQQDASMDAKTSVYDKMSELAELETEDDTLEYLNRLLADEDRYIICIAGSNEYLSKIPEDVADALTALGLKAVNAACEYHDAYVAYIDAGDVVYEQLSNRPIYWHSTERGVTDIDVSIESSGWFSGNKAVIRLNNRNLAANARGLNVLVIDKATQLPLDSMLTDALIDAYSCDHYYETEFHAGYWLGTED